MSVSTWQQPLPAMASAQRSALVADVAERVLACGDRRLRVGIDGLTAAGKTSFGHELAQQISLLGRPVLRASLDDFKRPWRDRHRYDRESGDGYYRNAFDYDTVVRLLLRPAGPDGSGACVLCSIDPLTQREHRDVVTHAAADAVLIVDGVFAFRPEINAYWDFRIWLDVDEQTSVRRGTCRDRSWAGAEAEAVHRDRYLAAERLYLADVDPLRLVDVVIDNTVFHRPRVLRARQAAASSDVGRRRTRRPVVVPGRAPG
ncbi:uridine kinase [Polymorphospora rubra]